MPQADENVRLQDCPRRLRMAEWGSVAEWPLLLFDHLKADRLQSAHDQAKFA